MRSPLQFFFCIWFITYVNGSLFYSWPSPPEKVLAQRSQRDAGLNITIDSYTGVGIALSSILFKPMGYVSNSLTEFRNFLSAGVSIFKIDLYWNEATSNWQLCPGPFPPNNTDATEVQTIVWNSQSYTCQANFTLDSLISSLSDYLDETNTDLSTNLYQLLLTVHSLNPQGNNYSNVSLITPSLSQALNKSFPFLYTPPDLISDRLANLTYSKTGKSESGYPTVWNVLFDEKKMLVPILLQNNLNSNTSYNISADENTIFSSDDIFSYNLSNTSNLTCPISNMTLNNILELFEKPFNLVIDSDENSFNQTNFEDYMNCGYSIIFNSSSASADIYSYINDSLWSWAPNQPSSPSNTSNETYQETHQVSNKCAALYDEGWRVDNCYNKYKIACRKDTRAFEWVLSDQENTYFDADCPEGYIFSVPRSALQMSSLKEVIVSQKEEYPVWIDMNSITIDNCWVSGGPYASCPYEYTNSSRIFVRMITPASMVAGIILALIFLSKFRDIPIHSNRKHWKKIINEHPENDYEGVPS